MSLASSQLQQLPSTELDDLIKKAARFKQRSFDTHTQTHHPQLESPASTIVPALLSLQTLPQIDVVLLGDSMLERFKTSGNNTQIGQMSYPQLFNAGVGGDKIENVLYRVDLGLLRLLKPKNPKVVVIHLGTNNLQQKRGLECQHLDEYYLLLQALLISLSNRPKVLVTGLFKRRDIDEEYITQSNMALEALVARISKEEMKKHEMQQDNIHWMAPPKEIGRQHLDDNVHLNTNGYKMWDTALYLKIQELLSI